MLLMPSWMSDWIIKPPYRPTTAFETILDVKYSFNATMRMHAPYHDHVLDDKKILTVQGIIVDIVSEVAVEISSNEEILCMYSSPSSNIKHSADIEPISCSQGL
jgi:hypothetical protein